jgi:hypothetical protein
MRRLIASIALIVLGAGGGYLLGASRAQPAPPVAVVAARSPAERAPIIVADRGLSETDLRRVVQEELSVGGRADSAALAPPAASPGDRAAFDAAMRRVSLAIAQRRWTRDDAEGLGRALETTSPEQRTAILHTLIPALNRGEVKLTYRGELF